MSEPGRGAGVNPLARTAVVLALLGLLAILLFLARGFSPWSVGVGAFLGMPLLLLAMVFYLAAAFRDLRRQGLL